MRRVNEKEELKEKASELRRERLAKADRERAEDKWFEENYDAIAEEYNRQLVIHKTATGCRWVPKNVTLKIYNAVVKEISNRREHQASETPSTNLDAPPSKKRRRNQVWH